MSLVKVTSRTLYKWNNKIKCGERRWEKVKIMTWPKRCVFRRRLKMPSASDAVTLDGKVFQTRGSATKNARSPTVVLHEDGDGVTRADVSGEETSSAVVRLSLHRCGRAPPSAAACTRQSANARQLSVGDRQTNGRTDKQRHRHRVKPPLLRRGFNS